MSLSEANQDYLKAIYKLRAHGTVTTQALADRLKVAPPSATAMIKKLAALQLVTHTPYYGVQLTQTGEKIALEIIRHHRLVETYLTEVLGLGWDQAHIEAERWEHILSEEVEARMDAALGSPTRDPHGAAIPTLNGEIAVDDWTRLSEVSGGENLIVRRVSDENAELLGHLREIGLVPGAHVAVQRAVGAEGTLHLEIEGQAHVFGIAPARFVYVETLDETL
ncbi:MAG: metal-dependent transcriptional regulator [Armatimonadetes bacterium]|nr:metal-dependent transcriptional regulator [Armatimonadota bacterium]